MYSWIAARFSAERRQIFSRAERLRELHYELDGRPAAERLVREIADLLDKNATRLLTTDLRKLSQMDATVREVTDRRICDGWCNVGPDGPNPGPCLHSDGEILTYDDVPVECSAIVDVARRELERRVRERR